MTVSAQQGKTWAVRLLLAFVLVSIGFAFGKEMALRAQRRVTTTAPVADPATPPTAAKPQLIAYFMHGSIRCVTCLRIERQARQTIEKDFAAELASGRIALQESNFEEDPSRANRYNVSTSTVVLVRQSHDKELAFKRLDEVWTMIEKSPTEFAEFIHDEIADQLARGGE